MNRIIATAQLLGALLFCIAFASTLPARPKPGALDAVLLDGRAAWVNGKPLLKGYMPSPGVRRILVDLDWAANMRSATVWINDGLRGSLVRKSGAILAGDFHVFFKNALITSIDFPKLQSGSGATGNVGVRFDGELSLVPTFEYQKGDVRATFNEGRIDTDLSGECKGFKLEIEGVECSEASRVGAFGLKLRPSKIPIPPGAQVWGDPHISEITLPKSALLASGWFDPNFNVVPGKFRPCRGRLHYLSRSGKVQLTLSFRVAQLGKTTHTEGRSMSFELFFDTFSINRPIRQ